MPTPEMSAAQKAILAVIIAQGISTIACASPLVGNDTSVNATPDPLKSTVDAQGTSLAQNNEDATRMISTLGALENALTPYFTETPTQTPMPTQAETSFFEQMAGSIKESIRCNEGVIMGSLVSSQDEQGNNRLGVNLVSASNEGGCIIDLTYVIKQLKNLGIAEDNKFALGVTNPDNQNTTLLTVYDPDRETTYPYGYSFQSDGYHGQDGVPTPYMPFTDANKALDSISEGWDNALKFEVRIEIQELDSGENVVVFIVELPEQQ